MTVSNPKAFIDGEVTVEVPATSANLGPGFDALGIALSVSDTLTASIAEGITVTVTGVGKGRLPRDERHLVVKSILAAFTHVGVQAPGIRLHCHNRIPQSRGMGSSSAAIVGGLGLGRALLADSTQLTDDDLLMLANTIEGHPDNVAPAIYGGFTISGQDRSGPRHEVWAALAPVDAGIGAVLFVPPNPVSTKVARGMLPDSVPHAEAAANAGRTALLVRALGGAPAFLHRATEDFLHQSYRAAAMPDSAGLVDRLRGMGVPAVISGAGPTVLAFTAPGLPLADELARYHPAGWQFIPVNVAGQGVRVRPGSAT